MMKNKFLLSLYFIVFYFIFFIFFSNVFYISQQHYNEIKYIVVFYGLFFAIYFYFWKKTIIKILFPVFTIGIYYISIIVFKICLYARIGKKLDLTIIKPDFNEVILIFIIVLIIFSFAFSIIIMNMIGKHKKYR
ncbi:hypothetical protein JM98_02564 [Treponema putidum]|nr:hypothetical protein JM98_02564 [Treponema putidum]